MRAAKAIRRAGNHRPGTVGSLPLALSVLVTSASATAHGDVLLSAPRQVRAGLEARAEPADQVEEIREEPSDERLGTIVWIQPITSVIQAFSGGAALAVGTNIPLLRGNHLVLETFLQAGSRPAAFAGRRTETYGEARFGAGFSHVFILTRRGETGPFVQPKILGTYRHVSEAYISDDPSNPNPTRPQTETMIGLGSDVGFQFTDGRFYVAAVLGASLNYCFNCVESLPGRTSTGVPITEFRRGDFARVLPNLAMLRIGYIF